MKFSFLVCLVLIIPLCTNILASPPKGGIGDGYIRPIKHSPSKPITTTTYYAKPLYPPKKSGGPKPSVYKVIIHDQAAKKMVHLPQHGHGGGGHKLTKTVKIYKIIHVDHSRGSHGAGHWSR